MGFIQKSSCDTKEFMFYSLVLEQVEFELQSQIKYYNISQVFDCLGMKNLAKFFTQQAHEENEHAHMFMEFLSNNGIFYQIGTIQVPDLNIKEGSISTKKVLESFYCALEQERQVTAKIHVLYEVAKENRIFQAENLLSLFAKEQIEEENTMKTLIDLFMISGDNLLLLDNSDYVKGLLVDK